MTHTYPEPISYWQRTFRASAPAHEFPKDADVVVIGAGVHGASTAYWLARLGARPLVLERGLVANGASGRNGGLCVAGPAADYATLCADEGRERARMIAQDTLAGYRMLCEVIAEERIDAAVRPHGHLSLALSEAELAGMRASATLLREDGIDAQVVDAAGLRHWLDVEIGADVAGGKFNADSAQMHSGDLVHGLLTAAVRHGARICVDTEVSAVEPAPDGVRLYTSRGVLDAAAVCVALNAWTAQLIPALRKTVVPVRGQVLAYAASPRIFDVGIGVSVTPTGEYGQQMPSGEIVFGGCRANAQRQDVGLYDVDNSVEVQRSLEDVLPRLFPKIALGLVTDRWSGTMAFTPDHNPVFGRLGSMPVFYAGGYSGHGMPYAMCFGRWLAESAMKRELVPGAATYSPERFW